jgi:hypothetical protein
MATQPQDIQIYQPDAQVGELKLWRPPEQVLVEAQQVAIALQKRIAGKEKPVIFNGQQYIENDDWQFVSNFFGYAPKVISTEFVEYGDVQGFKAIAELIHEHTGRVVGRGEALCLDEEENWGPRTKYEWRDVLVNGQRQWDPKGGKNGKGAFKRERVATGEVNTPLFQLMSMAETRACNKAMSNKLKWVVTLAGYAATPAEDMHEPTMQPQKEQVVVDDLPTEIRRKPQASASASASPSTQRPGAVGREAGVTAGASLPSQPTWCVCGHISGQHGAEFPHRCACDGNRWIDGHGTVCDCQGFRAKPLTPQTVAPQPIRQQAPPQVHSPQPQREPVISEAQSRRFYAIWKGAGKEKSQVDNYLHEELRVKTDRDIPVSRYKEACAWAERQPSGERW